MTKLAEAFDREILHLTLDRLLPSRILGKDLPRSRKFEQIRVSMQEIGLIEPLSVTQPDARSGLCTVLDGHLRLAAARELGWQTVASLCSRDDEGYTYNNRVNRLATVQEHFMILRALERGVAEERLARALDLDIDTIRRKRDLLAGICPEAVELLKEAHFHQEVTRHLRKMKPARQVECVELMLSVNNFSATYAEALLHVEYTPAQTVAIGARLAVPATVYQPTASVRASVARLTVPATLYGPTARVQVSPARLAVPATVYQPAAAWGLHVPARLAVPATLYQPVAAYSAPASGQLFARLTRADALRVVVDAAPLRVRPE